MTSGAVVPTVSLPHPMTDANIDAVRRTLKLSLSVCIVSPLSNLARMLAYALSCSRETAGNIDYLRDSSMIAAKSERNCSLFCKETQ